MGRASTVSQKEVDEVCEELRLKGIEINSHSVRNKLGKGSYPKVYALILDWENRCLAADDNTEISDLELIKPFKAAIKILKKGLGDRYESEAIKQLEKENEELQEKVMNYEKSVIGLETKIETLQQSIESVVSQTVDRINQERDTEIKELKERIKKLEGYGDLMPRN
jgi:molecular chaperone DnaK (HSP70)